MLARFGLVTKDAQRDLAQEPCPRLAEIGREAIQLEKDIFPCVTTRKGRTASQAKLLLDFLGEKEMQRSLSARALLRAFIGLFAVAFLASACAGPRTPAPQIDAAAASAERQRQEDLFVERQFAKHKRLWRVGYPLLVAGAELCGEAVVTSLGLYALARQYFRGEHESAVARVLNLTDRPKIAYIAPGSPADAAGFEVGDELLEVGTQKVQSDLGSDHLNLLFDRTLKAGEPVALRVQRGAERLYIDVTPVNRCDYELELTDDDVVNAYADGKKIMVTEGMLKFAETDQHLAVIVGHELAHNTMGHIDAKQTNAVAGGAGGLLLDIGLAILGVNTGGAFTRAAAQAGAGAYSVGFEQEADYVGLYYVARAGYDLDGAADVWRMMATENPNSITISNTHPTTPDRFLALEQHIEEIKDKMAAGVPLVPEVLPEPEAGGAGGSSSFNSGYPD